MQHTLQQIEPENSRAVIASFEFNGQVYRRNRRTNKSIDTRFGVITIQRCFFQNTQDNSQGIAPLDVWLGLFANRMTPALAEVTGRLAADMTQSAARDMLRERFGSTPGVAAYRDIIADRRKRGEPIGSGITEAGCKVIFNQRLKQSGMRWHRETGQQIVDLRTATKSGLWAGIWQRLMGRKESVPKLPLGFLVFPLCFGRRSRCGRMWSSRSNRRRSA